MPKPIRIIYVPVGEPPGVLEIEDSSAALQKLVGGYFESHSMGWNIHLLCHEDGIGLGLPQNGCGILGPYAFMKSDYRGEAVSLNEDDCQMILAHIAVFRDVEHDVGSEVLTFPTRDDLDEWGPFLDRQRWDFLHRN